MLTRTHLQFLAGQRIREAEALLDARLWSGAYYLAGYSAELGLKAVVAGRFSADEIPDRGFVNSVYTHVILDLVRHAGLTPGLNAELDRNQRFRANWEVVRGWSEAARYQSWSEPEARQLVDALADPGNGVFGWIQAHW